MSADPFAAYVVSNQPTPSASPEEDPFAAYVVDSKKESPGILSSIGSGIMAGLSNIGAGMARADPFTGPGVLGEKGMAYKEKLQEAEQEEAKRQAQEIAKRDALDRIAYKTGRWTGEGLPFMAVPAAGGARALGTALAKDVAIGAGSSTLQEGELPAFLADLTALAASKGIGMGARAVMPKKVPSDVKTIAPYAQEAYKEVFGEGIPSTKNIHLPTHSDFLSPKNITTKDDAGEALIKALEQRKGELVDARSAKAKPLYETVDADREGYDIEPFKKWLSDYGRHAKGKTKTTFSQIDKMLTPNKQTYMEDIRKGVGKPKIEAGEVQATLENLGDQIESAIKKKEYNHARKLTTVKKTLEEMVVPNIPSLGEATKTYSEYSKPLNALTKHPLLGKAFEADYDIKAFKAVIPDALQSKSMAKDLVTELKHAKTGKDALSAIKQQVHAQILKNITSGEKGEISLQKIASWKRENPGAFVLDPTLSTKLDNLSNVKYFQQTVLSKVLKQPVAQTISNETWGLFKNLKKVKDFTVSQFDKLKKTEKQLSKIPKERKEEIIEALLNDPKTAEFMMTPVENIPKYLYINPGLNANMQRIINDLSRL